MIKILFTCVGRRVELVQSFVAASYKLKREVEICATDSSALIPARVFCNKFFISPKINDGEYVDFLLSLCQKEKIDALIPMIDTDLMIMARSKEKFEKAGTKVLIAAPEKVALCRDKSKTGDYFRSVGLNAPACYKDYTKYDGGFPAFIKPVDGSSSIDAHKVDDEEELAFYAKRMKDYVVQPFIKGTEYTIDIFCDFDGNPIYITPRIRIAVRSGEVLKTKIDMDAGMINEMKALLKDFKPSGAITVQLIKDEKGVNHYIEINPRYGGGAPLSIKAGANSPEALIKLLQGKKLSFIEDAAENGAVYCRYDQSVCLKGV